MSESAHPQVRLSASYHCVSTEWPTSIASIHQPILGVVSSLISRYHLRSSYFSLLFIFETSCNYRTGIPEAFVCSPFKAVARGHAVWSRSSSTQERERLKSLPPQLPQSNYVLSSKLWQYFKKGPAWTWSRRSHINLSPADAWSNSCRNRNHRRIKQILWCMYVI